MPCPSGRECPLRPGHRQGRGRGPPECHGWRWAGRASPQKPAYRVGEDLHVHPVFRVFPGGKGAVGGDHPCLRPGGAPGRSAAGDRPGGERPRRGGPHRRGRGGCEAGPAVHGLGAVAVGGGGQGLAVGGQARPPGTGRSTVLSQAGGEEAPGGAGHVRPGGGDGHVRPLVGTGSPGR